jgi:transcriptional regulator with XRE-family HTH domain
MLRVGITTEPISLRHYGFMPKGRAKHMPLRLYLKEWRKFRGFSQERLAEVIGTTKATVSRIENLKQNWDQEFLQLAADALRCAPGDLLMRDPSQHEAIWSIWDQLAPLQREQVVEIAKTIKRTGTDG